MTDTFCNDCHFAGVVTAITMSSTCRPEPQLGDDVESGAVTGTTTHWYTSKALFGAENVAHRNAIAKLNKSKETWDQSNSKIAR